MNHLCGLSIDSSIPSLNTDETSALDEFRKRYDSECYTSKSVQDIADEEKKEPPQSDIDSKCIPTYEISHDDLPDSGWRPLDDVTLYRYLLADRRHDDTFDQDASFNRLMEALKFRKERKTDIIVKNISNSSIPPVVARCQRLRVGIWAGFDNEGRPIKFERLGQFFSSGNCKKVEVEDWIEAYLYFLEANFSKMREAAETTGKPISRICYFADFQGVVSSILSRKIWSVTPLLKRLVSTVECHYPEIVDHITLFNVPRIASAAYTVVKGFLDPVTAAKIDLYPGVPLDRFRELMSDEVIPVEYGGKNELDYPQTALD